MKTHIGNVSVWSGKLLITDPVELRSWIDDLEVKDLEGNNIDNSYSYNGAIHQTTKTIKQGGELGPKDREGACGVVFVSGHGDGDYPVYAEYDKSKHIKKIIINLDEDMSQDLDPMVIDEDEE